VGTGSSILRLEFSFFSLFSSLLFSSLTLLFSEKRIEEKRVLFFSLLRLNDFLR